MDIREKLTKIQSELKAPKSQRNNFGKYNYRSCEDILEAVKPIAHKYGCSVLLSDEIRLIGDRVYVEAKAILACGSDEIGVKASAREPEAKKGMDESQITGAASSYARKYALNGLFAIDDTKDADATNDHSSKPKHKKLAELKPNTEAFKKVKDAMGKGFTLEQVKSKYSVSKEVEELLTKTK